MSVLCFIYLLCFWVHVWMLVFSLPMGPKDWTQIMGLVASPFTCETISVARFYLFLFIPINLVQGYLFFCCQETLLNAFSLPQIHLTYFNSQVNLFAVLLSSFHSLIPTFPVSFSKFIKSKIPPSSCWVLWHSSSSPLVSLPLHNTVPVLSLLCSPVCLCYIDQIQWSFCCSLTALDRRLCMCCNTV